MDEEKPSRWPSFALLERIQFRRVGVVLVVLVVLFLAGYLASLYNRSKYFLVVDATHVRVEQGRMLPFGSELYIPDDPQLLKAYRAVPLPSGWQVPAGVSSYGDLTQLEQALFRILMDAAEFTLNSGDAATAEQTTRYLNQIDALAHLSAQQTEAAARLRRTARYVEARGHFNAAVELLKKAQILFEGSATTASGDRYTDGKQRAESIRQALVLLVGVMPAAIPSDPEEGTVEESAAGSASEAQGEPDAEAVRPSSPEQAGLPDPLDVETPAAVPSVRASTTSTSS